MNVRDFHTVTGIDTPKVALHVCHEADGQCRCSGEKLDEPKINRVESSALGRVLSS